MICQRKRLMKYFLPRWYPKKILLTRRRVREGGGKMDNESKKPCAPVEEEGRDYDALGLFRREGDNETLMAAMGLWEFLPAWMDARRMALVDPDYNRKISSMVADLAGTVQKAAREMAEWGQEECAPGRME